MSVLNLARRMFCNRPFLTLAAVVAASASALVPAAAQALPWNTGDVFVGVGDGKYNVYDNSGTFKETIDQGNHATYTTGCAFDSSFNLYTTNFSGGEVIKFDGSDPHSVLQTITATSGAEDVVFDQAGNFYVTSARSADVIHKYDASGTFVTDYSTGESDWVDLAANQTTMFFTGESGGRVQRFDLAANTALTDFASVDPFAYALRLLPPGDGSGGLLVADSSTIKRLDGTGAVTQTYDATGQDNWFALNLDPNGTSFWSGDLSTGNVYRFNIATGAIEVGPIAGRAFGICVKGEPTAAVSPPPPPPPPPPPTPTPTPTVKDTTAPKIAVKGVAASNAACRSKDFTASVTVREAALKRVDVFLDGKRIKRTSKKKATFRIAAATLKSGKHTVKVVATDKSGNRSARTSSFTRCARKAVVHRRPRFTG